VSDISPRKKTGDKPQPKSANYTADIDFTHYLVKDMENLMCLDTSRIYAFGLGVGGGMMHMLACHPELSTSFAAFAAVGGIFGRSKEGKKPWGVCKPKRQIPILEIHGLEDRIAGYYLRENENGKKRMIPSHWLDDWAERNQCGEPTDESYQSPEDEATYIARLEHGVMSETIQHGGAALRIAKKCKHFLVETEDSGKEKDEEVEDEPTQSEEAAGGGEDEPGKEDKDQEEPLPTTAISNEEATILHYQLKSYGHGWPRQHLKRQKDVYLKDKKIDVKDDTFFDTTNVILDFFKGHKLEEQFAKRSPILKGEEGGPPSEDEMAAKMAALGMEHAELGKKKQSPTEAEIEEKLKQFRAAQENINKMKKKPEVKDQDRDEL
jgi:poly(3-hydroxybutyrate) depolymerase